MRMLEEAVYSCILFSTQTWCLYPSCGISSIAVFGNKAMSNCMPTSLVWDYMMLGSMGGVILIWYWLVAINFLDSLWPDDSARWNVTGSLKSLTKLSWKTAISGMIWYRRVVVAPGPSLKLTSHVFAMSQLMECHGSREKTGKQRPLVKLSLLKMWKKAMCCLN